MSSVLVNPPKTPVTKGSNGTAMATIPNVCKMPGPPAPFVPVPLPNIGKSGKNPQGYSQDVTIEGKEIAIKGATFESMGDVASKGTGGGLISANCEGITKFVGPGSMDVKVEGNNVQLLSDPMLNNCGPGGSPPNAATMVGVLQDANMIAVMGDEPCPLCGKNHGENGKLEETADSKGAVTDVENAIKAALAAANSDAARLSALDRQIADLRNGLAGAAAEVRNQITKDISKLANTRKIELSAMMGAVTCKCGSAKHAGTSFVQYKDVVKRYGHHAPRPYFSLTKQPRKGKGDDAGYSPRRGAKFRMAVAAAYRAKFRKIWKERKANSEDSLKGNTDEVAYPPGSCAGQLMVVHAMDHKCRPIGLTERYFSSRTNPAPLTKLWVRDLGADGVPGPKRLAQPEELTAGKPIPPCATCQVILQCLMCPDDKTLECAYAAAKACSRC